MSSDRQMAVVHASCVSVEGNGLLVFGKAGSGKSTLALQMIELGASLVSDDQTTLSLGGNQIYAAPPSAIVGLIEVRGVGILTLPNIGSTQIKFCVDLEQVETERLPTTRFMSLLNIQVPCLRKVEGPAFPIALMHYLRGRKVEA